MRQISFDKNALEDLHYWVKVEKKVALRIIELIQESAKNPYTGRGKPKPLKYDLKGCWSRRINQEHRLVYEVTTHLIRILSCRYHY